MSGAYDAKHTDICLGRGEWIVGHAIYQGTPAIVFTPTAAVGEPGSCAEGLIPNDRLVDGAIVLRLATMDAALRHSERLNMAVSTFAEKVGVK